MPTQWWPIQESGVDLLRRIGLVELESPSWSRTLSRSIVSISWNLYFRQPLFNCSHRFLRFGILHCWEWHHRQNWQRFQSANFRAQPVWWNIRETRFREKWSRNLVWVQHLRREPSRWWFSLGDWYPWGDTGQEYSWSNRWVPRPRQTDFELGLQASRQISHSRTPTSSRRIHPGCWSAPVHSFQCQKSCVTQTFW